MPPRKRKRPTLGDRMAEVPTIKGVGSAQAKKRPAAGQARDTYMLRQTQAQTPSGTRTTGNGDGRGSYGPNRLHGRAGAEARAESKKAAWPRTQEAMEDFLASGGTDIARLLPFRPTNSIGPLRLPRPRRPRTKAAGYDSRSKTVRILFAEGESWTSLDGAIYEYYGVPANVWRMVRRNVSTGRTINRTLNNFAYAVMRSAPNRHA